MRARAIFVALILSILGLVLVAPSGAESETASQGSAAAAAGICLDGSQPYNGRCCVDHDCRRTYPAIGTLPGGSAPSRSTSLSGWEQSETSAGDPDGTGHATLTFLRGKSMVCFDISHSNIDPTQAGHVHLGDRRANGPPVVNLYSSLGVSSSISGCTQSDPVTIDGIIDSPQSHYVQLHNGPFPLGVVRGQLGD